MRALQLDSVSVYVCRGIVPLVLLFFVGRSDGPRSVLPSRVGEGRHGRRARAGQAEIDTPDGKPNAEWLTFRHNKLFRQPLEATEELGSKLSDSFNEAPPPHPLPPRC